MTGNSDSLDEVRLALAPDSMGFDQLWVSGGHGREDWPIEYHDDDIDDLEAGSVVPARALGRRFVTDRAHAQRELDDALVRVFRRDLDDMGERS